MSSNLWIFHFIQRHEQGGNLLKPLTLYRWPAFKVWHQQIARCAKSRLIDIFLSISPNICNFLSNTNQNYIGTYIHISKLWRVFGNCQYIFMRQKRTQCLKMIKNVSYEFSVISQQNNISSNVWIFASKLHLQILWIGTFWVIFKHCKGVQFSILQIFFMPLMCVCCCQIELSFFSRGELHQTSRFSTATRNKNQTF